MGSLIARMIAWALGTAVARLFTGGAVALVTYTSLNNLVPPLLDNAVASLGQLAAPVLNVLLLAGFGTAINVIFSAIIARTAIIAGRAVITSTQL